MSADSPVYVLRFKRVLWISAPVAFLSLILFPFHVTAFSLAILAGAVLAISILFRHGEKNGVDAFRFLATILAGVLIRFSGKAYPLDAMPYGPYFVIGAAFIAVAIGSGIALVVYAIRKRANQSLQPTAPSGRG